MTGKPAAPLAEACQECGHVGCCDAHQGHATSHALESGPRLIRAWKGGAFVYCYEHGYL